MNTESESVVKTFRIRQEDRAAFAKFCEEQDLTQAEAFEKAIAALGFEAVKQQNPEREAELSEVQEALDLIMIRYTDSIRFAKRAQETAKKKESEAIAKAEEKNGQLKTKIAELLDEERKMRADFAEEKKESEKRLKDCQKDMDALRETVANKEEILKTKDAEIEMLKRYKEDYEALRQAHAALQTAHSEADSLLKAQEKDFQKQLEEITEKTLEEKALLETEKTSACQTLFTQVQDMKDQLRNAEVRHAEELYRVRMEEIKKAEEREKKDREEKDKLEKEKQSLALLLERQKGQLEVLTTRKDSE